MPVKEYTIKVTADTKSLLAALEKVKHLAENNPDVMKAFDAEFSSREQIATINVSTLMKDEAVCVVGPSDKLLDFLARHS